MSSLLTPAALTLVMTIVIPLGLAFLLMLVAKDVKVLGFEISKVKIPKWLAALFGCVCFAIAGALLWLALSRNPISVADLEKNENLASWTKIDDSTYKGIGPLEKVARAAFNCDFDSLNLILSNRLHSTGVQELVESVWKTNLKLQRKTYVFLCDIDSGAHRLTHYYAPQQWQIEDHVQVVALAVDWGEEYYDCKPINTRNAQKSNEEPLLPVRSADAGVLMLVWALDENAQNTLDKNTNGIFTTLSLGRRPQ